MLSRRKLRVNLFRLTHPRLWRLCWDNTKNYSFFFLLVVKEERRKLSAGKELCNHKDHAAK